MQPQAYFTCMKTMSAFKAQPSRVEKLTRHHDVGIFQYPISIQQSIFRSLHGTERKLNSEIRVSYSGKWCLVTRNKSSCDYTKHCKAISHLILLNVMRVQRNDWGRFRSDRAYKTWTTVPERSRFGGRGLSLVTTKVEELRRRCGKSYYDLWNANRRVIVSVSDYGTLTHVSMNLLGSVAV
jgi:hypothetical protein